MKHELTVCSDSETLKKELRQSCGKRIEQVEEFNLIIWEKDKELESLKKELEAKNVIVQWSTQAVTEQFKVEGITLGMWRNTLLQLNETFHVTTLGDPVATEPHDDHVRTSSQLLIKLKGHPVIYRLCATKRDFYQFR